MSEDGAVAISLGKLLEGLKGLEAGLECLIVATLWLEGPALHVHGPALRLHAEHSRTQNRTERARAALEAVCAPEAIKHLAALHMLDVTVAQGSDWRAEQRHEDAEKVDAEVEANVSAVRDVRPGDGRARTQQFRLGVCLARLPDLRHLTAATRKPLRLKCAEWMLPAAIRPSSGCRCIRTTEVARVHQSKRSLPFLAGFGS